MTISSLNILENGTLADVTPVNQNFETLRTGVNTNESNISGLSSDLQDLTTEVESISAIVMPDLTYEKLDSQFLVAKDKSNLTIKAGTTIRLDVSSDDVRYLEIKEDTDYNIYNIMDSGVQSLTAGKDYYIYIVAKDVTDSGTGTITKTVELKGSINSTYPTGYTASNSRKIGGFHTLCQAVTSSNAPALIDNNLWQSHPAIGYNAGDIIPNSVWCLSHRPIAEPAGMVYVDMIDKWVDIYLQSGTGLNTASAFGATVTDSRTHFDHQWDMEQVKKQLASDNDFTMFAEGSNQNTAIYGSAAPNPKTSGGHTDTSGKRMISGFFVEECCGFLTQWLNEIGVAGETNWANQSASSNRGQSYGNNRCLPAGGSWGGGSCCGSRCRAASNARSYVNASIGGRGVSLPLRV